MGKLIKYPESEIFKEIEKDGFKDSLRVVQGNAED